MHFRLSEEEKKDKGTAVEHCREITKIPTVDQIMSVAFVVVCSLIVTTCSAAATMNEGGNLNAEFYQNSCPRAQKIATDVARFAFVRDPTLAASLLRLFFHDCFVNGCDASILLDSTTSGEPIEKTSPANGKTLRGFELIDEIKARIENECPGIVSCADILAFATRDATVFSGIPNFIIPSGRRDGLSSRAADVTGNLPTPTMTVGEMTEVFTKKGITVEEMVVLTGAHSIGRAQCGFVENRLHNFSGTETRDPKLDATYARYLSTMCSSPGILPGILPALFGGERKEKLVSFDPLSPFRLDNSFYLRLREGRALLRSDQNMADDPTTAAFVEGMAADQRKWMESFVSAMVRLSRVGVITGNAGEIRKNCRAIN